VNDRKHGNWLVIWLLIGVIAVATGLLIRARRAVPGPAAAPTGLLGQSFRYDVKELRKVDPGLMIGHEDGSFVSPVAGARALAVDMADRIYVGGEQAIAVLEAGGRTISSVPVPFAVQCLAVDEAGTLYAGHADHVGVYSLHGQEVAQWPSLGSNAVLTSIVALGGEIVVADAGNRTVWRMDRQGTILGRMDGRHDGAGGFVIPSPHFDLAVGVADELWVVDPGRHTLMVLARDGSQQSTWSRSGTEPEGFSGCCNPTDIAIRRDGSFVTSEKGLVRVKLYTPAGTLIGVIAGPDQFDEDVRGLDLAVDSRDRVLVLDPVRNRVRVFEVKQP
jgi:hypothetical protein